MIIFPASAEPPADYPHGLPFIPGMLVEITEFDDAAVMKWFSVERPFDVVQQLTAASARDGWQLVPVPTGSADDSLERRRLTAEGFERDIEVLHAGPFTSVVLRQRRRTP